MNVVYLVSGALLLLTGRRLYWLFVAVVGFAAGWLLAQEVLGANNGREWAMLIGVIGGILGAVFAVFFQKVAVTLAGAVAGGFGGWILCEILAARSIGWLGVILGAVLGGILVLRLFDWGLIFFSSVAGARLVVIDGMRMDPVDGAWLFLVAFAVGIAVQSLQLVRARKRPESIPKRAEKTRA